jgi:uncharacterized protein (DUF924 family)
MAEPPNPSLVVDFWVEAGRAAWFRGDPAFDQAIRERLGDVHLQASRGEFLEAWSTTPYGALALVLVLDQIPRNLFRGSAHAFATDPLARQVAGQALVAGFDLAVDVQLQPFFYLPFEHHEDPASQVRAVDLMTAYERRSGTADYLRYSNLHAELIERFGRFPHRNRVLGRRSTAEEIDYLARGGFQG